MDLGKASPREVAPLILNGRLELGEIPLGKRKAVEVAVGRLKEKKELEAMKAKKKAKKAAAEGEKNAE